MSIKFSDFLSMAKEKQTIQYDSSSTVIGGKNILESFDTKNNVIFNESYTIIGAETTASQIGATYDLTIIGNVEVEVIKVNGDLTIIGDITAKNIFCANAFICQGNVNAEVISVGSIIANSVKCKEFSCDGNAIIETTIDIDKSSRTEKTMIACEGIIGAGSFEALNAIANEYFEFSGDINGKIVELESNTTISELTVSEPVRNTTDISEMSIMELLSKFNERLQLEFSRCTSLDEDEIAELLKSFQNNTNYSLQNYAMLFNELTDISYQDEIADFGDYLLVKYAKKTLPAELYHYETIEHIDTLMLKNAEAKLNELEFEPKSIEHLAFCLKSAIRCLKDIPMESDLIFDKIFSSIGIRYSTIEGIIGKYQKDMECETIKDEIARPNDSSLPKESLEEIATDETDNQKTIVVKATKEEYKSYTLQHEKKHYGITDNEVMHLASVRIKTCGDFMKMSESDLKTIFKKKLFIANHLYNIQQKMKSFFEELD